MDLIFWDPGVAKRYCSRNSSKVRQCWLDGVLFIACSDTLWRDSLLDPFNNVIFRPLLRGMQISRFPSETFSRALHNRSTPQREPTCKF